ncbi:MAG: ABC transporter permease [Halobacteriales archaeon SW_9_67_25]|jgi:simple sugar transport system permease protein|nr:MAG: ABC transporter permease [Halobacteriales archaeon SW_9_67_25]
MNVELDIGAREDVPTWLVYGTPVFTVLAALAVSSVALVALDVSPVAAYSVMFVETLTSEFGLTETTVKAIPLVLTGLAVYLPLRAGLWNIGAEGQLILGGLAGTWIGLNVSAPGYALLVAMFLGAGVAGAFWAAVPAWLRAKYDINEIITTLLLTFVALNLKNYLIRGPMQGGAGTFPQTEQFSGAATIPSLFGNVHAGLLVALLMVAVAYVLVTQTRLGFEVTFVGSNPEAATQAGISRYKVYILVFVIGGLFAGFAGIGEIAGVQGRFRADFEPGYGFTAIVIALLGRNGALKVLLAGFFFALLIVGGSSMEVALGVPAALTEVIQALVILFLITAEFFKRYSVSLRVDRDPGTSPATRTGSDA